MIATAVIAGVSAAAGIAGGIAKTESAKKQYRALQRQIAQQEAENRAWYDRRYNEDFLQRSENKAVLEQARKRLMQSSRASAGTSAVMGSSNAVAAAQKEANNEAYTGLVSSVASNASAKRDAIEDRYLTNKKAIQARETDVTNAKYNANQSAIDTAVNGVQGVSKAYLAGHTPSSGNEPTDVSNDPMVKMADSTSTAKQINEGASNEFYSNARTAPVATQAGTEFDQANKMRLAQLMFPNYTK